MITRTIDLHQFPKPYFCPSKTLFTPPFQFSSSSRHVFTKSFRVRPNSAFFIKPSSVEFSALASSSNWAVPAKTQEEDTESAQLFEKLKEAERERVNKLEELERKANVQLERQLVMASDWSRALLTMRGKLKETEWDPENSHRIDYSEFLRLLNSNNVQYMEYSNYGQTVSDTCMIIW